MIIKNNISTLFIGLNWGAISEKGWYGEFEMKGIDLDLGAFIIKNGKIIDRISYANTSSNKIINIEISLDDHTGDLNGNDYIDNEVVTVNFDNEIQEDFSIIFFINSYSEMEFGKIPYVENRIYDGILENPSKVYFEIDYTKNKDFINATAVIIGELVVTNESKDFYVINKFLTKSDLVRIEGFVKDEILNLRR